MPSIICLILALALADGPSPGEPLPFQVNGYNGNQPELGCVSHSQLLAVVGDVDLDGAPDLLLSAPRNCLTTPESAAARSLGSVWLLSGSTDKVLRYWVEEDGAQGLGEAVLGPGDLDRDGVPEIAIAAPGARGGAGCVRVFSALERDPRYVLEGAADAIGFGSVLASSPADAEGAVQIVISSLASSGQAAAVHVHDGASGAFRFRCVGPREAPGFGAAIDASIDVDGDGIFDLVIGQPADVDHAQAGPRAGSVQVRSGRDGSCLVRIDGPADRPEFGASVCALPAFGIEGRPALAIAAPCARRPGTPRQQSSMGHVYVHDMEGRLLATLDGCTWDSGGLRVQRGPDLNRDGADDLILIMPRGHLRYGPTGWSRTISARDGSEIAKLQPGLAWDFAASLCVIPDADEDGIADFLCTNTDVGVQRVSSTTVAAIGGDLWKAAGVETIAARHVRGAFLP